MLVDCGTDIRFSLADVGLSVHSHYNQLRTLPDQIKEKMQLIHYQDNVIDEWEDWCMKAHQDRFMGFVNKGDVIVNEE